MKHVLKGMCLGFGLVLILTLVACTSGEPAHDSSGSSQSNGQASGDTQQPGDATSPVSGQSILMATPSIGSSLHTLGTGAAEFFYRHIGLNVSVEPIGGGEAPIMQMRDGTVHSAWVNTFVTYNASQGEGPFEEPIDNIRLFSLGDPTYRVLLVPKGSNIQSLQDLKGKVFMGIRPGLSEFDVLTKAILEQAGLTEGDLNIVSNTTSGETIDALRTRSVDVALYPGGAKNPNLMELFQDDAAEFLHLDETTMQELYHRLPPAFVLDTIEAGHYPNQEEDYLSLALIHTWVVNKDLSEEIVYHMAKAVWENFDEFSELHPVGAYYSVENNIAGPLPLPFHPGVKKYFQEIGVWDESLEVE